MRSQKVDSLFGMILGSKVRKSILSWALKMKGMSFRYIPIFAQCMPAFRFLLLSTKRSSICWMMLS